jgi:CheY-like chemotaxis protein
VKADPVRLRQVLLNLLGNAVKFTGDGGQVTFRVSRKQDAEGSPQSEASHTASCQQSSASLSFEVEDNGIGIPHEKQEIIFQPFEQIGKAERRAEGTGLGLAISRQLVHLMGGEIQMQSDVGRGSLFVFEIACPLGEESPETRSGLRGNSQRISGFTGSPCRVLVVDDNAENRRMLRDVLEPLSFEIYEAEHGGQAVEKTLTAQPNVILMDLIMPVMDGFDATREIRTMFPELPIIAVSASVPGGDARSIKEQGFDAFLLKPLDIDELFTVLQTLLPLEWTYEDSGPEFGTAESTSPEETLLPPPPEDVQALCDIADTGMMERVAERADSILRLDERYAPFVRQVKHFAEHFEDEKLLAFLKQYC